MTKFDALVTCLADMLCKSGGLERAVVARALFDRMDHLREAALALDAGVANLVIMFGLTADNRLVTEIDEFHAAMKAMLAVRPPVIRTTFVSLEIAADLVNMNAAAQGVDLGDRFGFSAETWADLVAKKAS